MFDLLARNDDQSRNFHPYQSNMPLEPRGPYTTWSLGADQSIYSSQASLKEHLERGPHLVHLPLYLHQTDSFGRNYSIKSIPLSVKCLTIQTGQASPPPHR